MLRKNLRVIGLIAICGVATLTGACTSAKSSGGPSAATAASQGTTAPKQAAGAADFALPIDSYSYTTQQEVEIVLANSILTGTCMKRFGFTYDLASDQATNQQAQQTQLVNFGLFGNRRRYGVADDDTARKFGYHLPSSANGDTTKTKGKGGPAHGLPPLTPAMTTVLTGERPDGGKVKNVDGQAVPAGGCRGEADATLAKLGTAGEIPIVGQIRADSFTRSIADPKVTAAFKAWSDCMNGKGYKYATPRDAGTDLDIDSPAPSAKELAVATADVACKKSTNVVSIWAAFETDFQNKQIDQHAQELKDVAAQRDALVKKVGDIIAAGGK